MSLDPNQSAKSSFPLIPEGNHPARCFAIVDIGKHYFMGIKDKQPSQKVMLCFEFTKFMHSSKEGEDKQPLIICQEYSFALGDKATLPKVLKSWGKLSKPIEKLNIAPYLGQFCSIEIEHNPSKKDPAKIYANIAYKGQAIKPLNGEKPKKHNKDILFDLDNFSWDAFNSLPFLPKKKLQESCDWSGITAKHPKPIEQGMASSQEDEENDLIQNDDSPNF